MPASTPAPRVEAAFRSHRFPVDATPPLDPHSLALLAVFDGPQALNDALRLWRRLERGHGLLEHPRLGPIEARVRVCTLRRTAGHSARAEVSMDFVVLRRGRVARRTAPERQPERQPEQQRGGHAPSPVMGSKALNCQHDCHAGSYGNNHEKRSAHGRTL